MKLTPNAACLILILLVGIIASVLGEEDDSGIVLGNYDNSPICSGKIGSTFYSLQKLADSTGGEDSTCQDWLGNTYYFRPCQTLQQIQCRTTDDPTPAACQRDTRRPPRFHDCGSTTAVTWKPRSQGEKTGFFLEFDRGEGDRKLDIEFECDPLVGIGKLEAPENSEDPPHFYHLYWKSSLACPTHQGGDGGGGGNGGNDGLAISGGWIAIIVLASLAVLYIVGGVLYNRFKKGAQGMEVLPNREFWVSLPGLVRDGTFVSIFVTAD